MCKDTNQIIAGTDDVSFLAKYIYMTEVINVGRLFRMLATEVVDSVDDADVVVSDEKFDLPLGENQIQIKSTDTEVLIALLNNKSSLTN